MKNKQNDSKIAINADPNADKSQTTVKNLDDLIELLDQDALRHVVGGRPKGKPTAA